MSIEHRPGHHSAPATKPIKQLLHDEASITLRLFTRHPDAEILLKDGKMLRELPNLTLEALRERLMSAGEGDPTVTRYIDTYGAEQVANLIALSQSFTPSTGNGRLSKPTTRLHFEEE